LCTQDAETKGFEELIRSEILYEISGMDSREALDFFWKLGRSGCDDGMLTHMFFTSDLRKIWEKYYDVILHITPSPSREWADITREAINKIVATVGPDLEQDVLADISTYTFYVSPEFCDKLEEKCELQDIDKTIKRIKKLSKSKASPFRNEAKELLKEMRNAEELVSIREIKYLPQFTRI